MRRQKFLKIFLYIIQGVLLSNQIWIFEQLKLNCKFTELMDQLKLMILYILVFVDKIGLFKQWFLLAVYAYIRRCIFDFFFYVQLALSQLFIAGRYLPIQKCIFVWGWCLVNVPWMGTDTSLDICIFLFSYFKLNYVY